MARGLLESLLDIMVDGQYASDRSVVQWQTLRVYEGARMKSEVEGVVTCASSSAAGFSTSSPQIDGARLGDSGKVG